MVVVAVVLFAVVAGQSNHEMFVVTAHLGNKVAIASKAFGRGNAGIPASVRGFFVNVVNVGYLFTAVNVKVGVKWDVG
ncbi:hypothetical protein BBROOKSOX_350 [Bathymodiolus brooksi thiotrophic gill symbiont]|nr:hypothetical protein BBROOKSOX_350 [Bathymodiolus brooksi thiotrophic gill symbiont]